MGDNGTDHTEFMKKNITPGYNLQKNGTWHHLVIDGEKMYVDGKEVIYKEQDNG